MLVIDTHAHIFPYLGGRSGYTSTSEHLTYCQWKMHKHIVQPVRRVKDNQIVNEETLWDPDDSTIEGKYDVNFRVGKFGRFEWTKGGVDYYRQYLPSTIQDMRASPGLIKAMMDYAGIDKAIVQSGGTYGKLNYYFASVMDEFPELAERFIAFAKIDEKEAYKDEEIAKLQKAIRDLGLKGLHFSADQNSFATRYRPFWDEVRDLGIPVTWGFYPKKEIWFSLLKKLGRWKEDYPTVHCILSMAFPLSTVTKDDRLEIPRFAEEIMGKDNIYAEIVYPIMRGAIEDYPYPISREAIRQLYDSFGGHKLVWGSDIPMVERYCTYSQSLKYLTDYCDFISKEDMELILGKNIQRVLDR